MWLFKFYMDEMIRELITMIAGERVRITNHRKFEKIGRGIWHSV